MKYSKTELLQVMKWMRISRIDTKKLKGKLLILHSKQLMRRGKRSKRFKDETGVKMTYRQIPVKGLMYIVSYKKRKYFRKKDLGKAWRGGDLLVHIFTSTGIFKKMSTPPPSKGDPPPLTLLHNYMCLIKPVVEHAYFAGGFLFLQHPQFVICNRLKIKKILNLFRNTL